MDEFLTGFPDSHHADEARALRAMLAERREAFKTAMASDDPAVLKTFLQAYPKGVQTDEVRKRLRRLEPGPAWLRRLWELAWLPWRRGLVTACLLGVVVVGAVAAWLSSQATVPPVLPVEPAVVVPPIVPAVASGQCGGGAVTVLLASRSATPLSLVEECALKPKDIFKEFAEPGGARQENAPAGLR